MRSGGVTLINWRFEACLLWTICLAFVVSRDTTNNITASCLLHVPCVVEDCFGKHHAQHKMDIFKGQEIRRGIHVNCYCTLNQHVIVVHSSSQLRRRPRRPMFEVRTPIVEANLAKPPHRQPDKAPSNPPVTLSAYLPASSSTPLKSTLPLPTAALTASTASLSSNTSPMILPSATQ